MDLSPFPKHKLTFGPTPVERWHRLGDHLGGSVEVWAKREDCNSGLAFGGNKLRKLEYLVPDAIANGCDTLVSVGAVQSNHTRQVAAAAASVGMDCHLVQGMWVDHPDGIYERVGNLLLSRILGAEIEITDEEFSLVNVRESWEHALEAVRDRGGTPYAVPAGASDHPLGGLGFAGFAEELRAQEEELGFRFDAIVVASASASTQAGMVAGFLEDERAINVLGIDVTARPIETRDMITKIASQTAERIGARRMPTADEVVLLEDYAAPAYGIASDNTIAAIRTCAHLEGVLTDPVYEGKSLHALIDLVRRGHFADGARVLYVHLGGVPVLSAYADIFERG